MLSTSSSVCKFLGYLSLSHQDPTSLFWAGCLRPEGVFVLCEMLAVAPYGPGSGHTLKRFLSVSAYIFAFVANPLLYYLNRLRLWSPWSAVFDDAAGGRSLLLGKTTS